MSSPYTIKIKENHSVGSDLDNRGTLLLKSIAAYCKAFAPYPPPQGHFSIISIELQVSQTLSVLLHEIEQPDLTGFKNLSGLTY
jgi:hypothetical protein